MKEKSQNPIFHYINNKRLDSCIFLLLNEITAYLIIDGKEGGRMVIFPNKPPGSYRRVR